MKAIAMTMAVVGLVTVASADLRSEITTMNKKVCQTMMKKDLAGFEKICKAGMTSDFKYSENGKAMSFDEMLGMMKQSFAQLKKVDSATSSIVSLKEKGGMATAMMKHTMVATMVGPDKKTHKMVMNGTSTDSYKKVGKEWKMSAMDWKDGKMTMDGKPMDMAKMSGGK